MADDTEQLIAGRYRLGQSLGSGGMGQVWAAEDTLLGRTVAVKIVDLRGRGDEESLRARVLREARAAARIDDPGSVRVFDVGDDEHRVWLVMELVEAPTLAEVVRGGPLAPERAADIGLDVLGALEAAHRAGIVHRDVKPNNVMVLPEGNAKLADFGIASVKDDPAITSTGMLLGTPKYMSPEQARGESAGSPSDLWGLGALLYFAVEGEPPFDRSEPLPTLNAVLHEEPRAMQRAGALGPVITALLAKDPAARPTTGEARRMLEGVLRAEPRTQVVASVPEPEPTAVVPPPVAPAPRRPAAPPADRRWWVAVAAIAVVALLTAVAIAATRDDGKGDDVATSSTTTTTAATSSTTASTTTTTEPRTTTTAPKADRPDGVPSDWVAYAGDGWSVWHPADWSAAPGPGGAVDITGPDGDYLRVGTTDAPGPDPKKAWEDQEKSFAAEHPDYQRIRIDDTTFQGGRAAIWEFTFQGKHAADLGFVQGDRGYALNLVTAESRWDQLADTWQAFQDSFTSG